jgi:hypothetical protein
MHNIQDMATYQGDSCLPTCLTSEIVQRISIEFSILLSTLTIFR